jgi:hypothetical protein
LTSRASQHARWEFTTHYGPGLQPIRTCSDQEGHGEKKKRRENENRRRR